MLEDLHAIFEENNQHIEDWFEKLVRAPRRSVAVLFLCALDVVLLPLVDSSPCLLAAGAARKAEVRAAAAVAEEAEVAVALEAAISGPATSTEVKTTLRPVN